ASMGHGLPAARYGTPAILVTARCSGSPRAQTNTSVGTRVGGEASPKTSPRSCPSTARARGPLMQSTSGSLPPPRSLASGKVAFQRAMSNVEWIMVRLPTAVLVRALCFLFVPASSTVPQHLKTNGWTWRSKQPAWIAKARGRASVLRAHRPLRGSSPAAPIWGSRTAACCTGRGRTDPTQANQQGSNSEERLIDAAEMLPANEQSPVVPQPREAAFDLVPAPILLCARDDWASSLGSPLRRASFRRDARPDPTAAQHS